MEEQIEKFVHKKSYERVVYSLRRHFITYVPTILLFTILLLVPIILHLLVQPLFNSLLSNPVIYPLMVLLGSTYYLSVILFFLTSFIEFYLDLHIITNDRIVDIEQKTLFARNIAELDLFQIQDVSSEVNGFFASIFNYGTVYIQSAASVPRFVMHDVPRPHHVRKDLLDLAAKDKRYHQKYLHHSHTYTHKHDNTNSEPQDNSPKTKPPADETQAATK